MADSQVNPVLQHIRRISRTAEDVAEESDRDLLERFTARHEEAIFEALVRRHGPLVLSVCRRVLNHEQDAEDAFQATFLVLARKAGSIRKQASLGSWLFGVAYRLALKARASAGRRHAHERRFAAMTQTEIQPEESSSDLRALLDEELLRLPEKYRAPLVLCYLEGKTQMEAARVLGWPSGSMTKRLQQAREMLRLRLNRRGVVVSSVVLFSAFAESARAALPAALVSSSVRAGVLAATGQALAGIVSAQTATWAEGVLKTMVTAKIKLWVFFLVGVSVLTAGAILVAQHPEPQKEDEQNPVARAPGLQEERQSLEEMPPPADLKLVPADAMGFLRVSVSDVWNLPAVKGLRGQDHKLTSELLSKAEKNLGVPVEEIEKVTLIALSMDPQGRGPRILGVLTTTKPYNRDKVAKALAGDGMQIEHNGKFFIAPKDGSGTAVHFAGDRIFLIADASVMTAYFDQRRPAKANAAFGRAVKLASGKHHLSGWFHLPEELAQQARQAPLPEGYAALRPLLDIESGSVILNFAAEARARISLRLPDEASAKQAQEAAQAGLKMLKEMLANIPAGVVQDPLIAVLQRLGDDALANAQVVREQTSIVLTAQTKAADVLGSVVPGVAKVRSAANRAQSTNNLKQIALAMHNYHDTYRRLPPATIADKNGQPLLSWRVAILPFIEQDGLYKEFHLDEPWDSEHNKKLVAKMPKVYAPTNIETKEPHTTLYKVFTGKSTPFEDPNGNTFADVTDGTSNTLLVVEGAGPVPWTKPEDLPFDPDQALPKMGGNFDDIFIGAMCDGSVRIMPMKIPEKTLRALITRNGGEKIED